MIGYELVALFGEGGALFLDSNLDAVHCLRDIAHIDGVLFLAGGEDCCFVQDVLKISTRHAETAPCYLLEIDRVAERLALRVDLQNLRPALQVGESNVDLSIKAAWT
jgi:hypothetical protein